MSFLVDEKGRIFVLDQVNSRIQVFEDGKLANSIQLPADTYNDIAVGPDGRVAVLDRYARDEILIMDVSSKILSQAKLSGDGIPEGGLVTAMFSREDGVWAEVNNEKIVQVAGADGRALESRKFLPGRPSRDSKILLSAALDGRNAAVVMTRPASNPALSPALLARIEFPIQALQLTALESDSFGRIYLAAYLARFREEEPYDTLEEFEQVVVLSDAGKEIARVAFPPRRLPEEVFRPVWVTAAGVVYQMAFEEHGVVFRRYWL